MLNQTPMWKYLLVVVVLGMCGLFAIPNLYGEDPAIQISPTKTAPIDDNLVKRVETTLKDANVEIKRIDRNEQSLLVRVTSNDGQLAAQEALEKAIDKEDYTAAMNLAPDTPPWLNAINALPIKLGLDLRGGVHFLMEVDMNRATIKALEGAAGDFKDRLREEKIYYRSVKELDDSVELIFREPEMLEKAQFFLRSNYGDMTFTEVDDLTLRAVFTDIRMTELRDYAVQQNITILRNRVNQLGVAEPLIQKQGADRIVVQLPGIQDSAKAKEILNATATLEFRMVDQKNDVRDAVRGRVPPSSELLYTRDGQPVLLKKSVMLEGSHIIDANSGTDENGFPQVNIDLDSEGGSKMSRGTKNNIGKPMATVFIEFVSTGERDADDKLIFEEEREVINVATIQARLGNSFRITGLDSPNEARDLSLLLRAGALIAPIQIVEERTVGPNLGEENIKLGKQAIIIGLAGVLLFMAIYYRAFGLVANVALITNVIMIIGLMSMIPGAALTLPGMAGIVLTVGMAVDANVLIFERIREEIRDGRSPQQAIHFGYDNAFSTILDANITTFIAGLILFAVGSGPIKGFSITLMIGIVTSMFTAIVVTRVLVNLIWGGRRVKSLSI